MFNMFFSKLLVILNYLQFFMVSSFSSSSFFTFLCLFVFCLFLSFVLSFSFSEYGGQNHIV